jgi:hypothetical protein
MCLSKRELKASFTKAVSYFHFKYIDIFHKNEVNDTSRYLASNVHSDFTTRKVYLLCKLIPCEENIILIIKDCNKPVAVEFRVSILSF